MVDRSTLEKCKGRQALEGSNPSSSASFECVGGFLTAWFDGQRSRVRDRTWMRRERLVRLHALPMLSRVPLVKLQPQHVEQLLAGRRAAGLGDHSVHQLRAVLHRAFEQAVRWNLVPRNAVHLVDAPRVTRKGMAVLVADEVRRLLNAAAGGPLDALLAVAVTTGLCRGELLGLRWRDVDLDRATARVTGSLQRGERSRTVPSRRSTGSCVSPSRRRALPAPGGALTRRRRGAPPPSGPPEPAAADGVGLGERHGGLLPW